MAFRTPISQFIAIDFMNNGEILDAANLNDRMLHKLDDKCEWLRSNLLEDVGNGSHIANLVGEDYTGTETSPCWLTNHNFAATDTHHLAIEGLDANVSRIDADTSNLTTRQNNNDVYLGEDSNVADVPSWITPNAFLAGASHHAAIQGLDNYTEITRATTDSLTTGQDALDIQMTTRIGEITTLQGDVGALKTLTGDPVTGHSSQISTLRVEMDTVLPVGTPGTLASKIASLEANIATINGSYKTSLLAILDTLGADPAHVPAQGPFTLPTV